MTERNRNIRISIFTVGFGGSSHSGLELDTLNEGFIETHLSFSLVHQQTSIVQRYRTVVIILTG